MSTLTLGQASYELLENLSGAIAVNRGAGTTTAFDVRSGPTGSGTIEGLNIEAQAGTTKPGNVNIFSDISELNANLSGGSDILNLFGSTTKANINTDGVNPSPGNDLLNALKNLTDSKIATGAGKDTIRVAGSANETEFNLGDGNDSLAVNGLSSDLTVDLGTGNDVAQFRGEITDGEFVAGEGNDTVQFFAGLSGSSPYDLEQSTPASAFVDLGSGNDALLIGGNTNNYNLQVQAGEGNDTLTLQGTFDNTVFDLGVGKNTLSLTSGNLNDSLIKSSSTTGDSLIFGAGTIINNIQEGSGILLGNGNDSVVFGGVVTSLIDTGFGADTIVFGARSTAVGAEINLGFDISAGSSAAIDKIYFNMSKADVITNFASLRITNADSSDILYVGTGSYTSYRYVSTTADNFWTANAGITDKSNILRFNG